ncbi:hypothetical protein MASR2M36_35270 [Providencia sp.]
MLACIDSDFNIIEEPEVFYCAPTDTVLPQPEAVMITGITPQLALSQGVNEAESANVSIKPSVRQYLYYGL